MIKLVLLRLATLVPLLIVLAFLVFVLAHIGPGDPAIKIAGADADPEAVERIRESLGLDQPLPVQFFEYLTHLLRGDLGISYDTKEPVLDVIARRLPRTASIAALALVIIVLTSIPMGIAAALWRGSLIDRALTGVSVLLIALPPFVLAAVLIQYLALGGGQWFPVGGYSPLKDGFGTWFSFAVLPAVTVAAHSVAELARQARGSMIDELDKDYVRTARAKGLSQLSVVGKHAAKNAAVPYVTILGLQVGRILGAAVIAESVFNVQGFGSLGVEAVLSGNIPVLQGVVLLSGLVMLLTNLLVDISYGYLNPRTRT